MLLLDRLALLLLGGIGGLCLPAAAEVGTVVGLVPLTEGGGIDLDDGGLGQGVGADQLVVGRVEGDGDDADLAGNALGTPGEVAGVETQGAELAVTTTGTDEMDALVANTGVGGLAALLESSDVLVNMTVLTEAVGLCIPLLAIVCALSTGGAALVTGVTRDTHIVVWRKLLCRRKYVLASSTFFFFIKDWGLHGTESNRATVSDSGHWNAVWYNCWRPPISLSCRSLVLCRRVVRLRLVHLTLRGPEGGCFSICPYSMFLNS